MKSQVTSEIKVYFQLNTAVLTCEPSLCEREAGEVL